jgi:hypothetical protein
MSVGKVLVRYSGLDERLARRWRKKQEQKGAVERPEFESVEKPSDACGSSRREKNRVTFFCRQHITGLFDPDATIEGHIGCSVLLVPATKPVRLEDMSFHEPSYWLRDFQMNIDGVAFIVKKGDRVGSLGSDWRKVRDN